ncbi:MAG: glycosyltransferase family 39 protein [Nanoarchaeota archaeon]
MNKNWRIFFIIIILVLSFLIRLYPIRMAHWWDETVYLQHAEIMFSGRSNFDELSFRPPLLSILFFLGFFIKHSVITASFITAMLGVLAVFFTYLIGKRVYGEKTGVVAGLIFAFVPFMTLNSNYLLTDVPVITLIAISFYFSLFRERKICYFFSGLFLGLSILIKFTAVLMILVFLLYFYLYKKELNKEKFVLFIIGFLLILVPYFIWCQISFGNFLTPFIQGQGMVGDKNESIFFYIIQFPKAFGYLIILGVILWIFSFIKKIGKKEYNIKNELIIMFWILLFLIYLTKTPHKELRYILPITTPVFLLASKGLTDFYNFFKKKYKLIWSIVFIFYLFFLIFSSYAFENVKTGIFVDRTITEEMKIADYLNETDYHGIIYTSQRWPVLAYYTGLETKVVYPYNEVIYSLIPEKMKDPGIFIGMYDAERFEPFKHPRSDWMNQDKRFKHIKDIGNFYIYEYTPS